MEIHLPAADEPVTPETFHFALRRDRLRCAPSREGHYLLRSNLVGEGPAKLWRYSMRLDETEQRSRNSSTTSPCDRSPTSARRGSKRHSVSGNARWCPKRTSWRGDGCTQPRASDP